MLSRLPTRTTFVRHHQRFLSSGSTIGVIGAGQIGSAVTMGLLRNQAKLDLGDVLVFDPSDKNKETLEGAGASWTDLGGVAAASDVVITALPAPPHVTAVMEDGGVLDAMKPNALWLDHTTSSPREVKRMAELAKASDVRFLECPLTGGWALLVAGLMTVFVGGPSDLLDTEARPILESYVKTILHLGEDVGQATIAKLITNQLAASHLLAAGEATLMAAEAGLDMRAFFDSVRASAGNSYVFETEAPLMFSQTFDPGFEIKLHVKDLLNARDQHQENLGSGRAYDATYPIHALSEDLYKQAMETYGGEVGSSFPAKMLHDRAGASVAKDGFDDWTYEIDTVAGGSFGVVHKNIEENK